jgi:hypothetical protein
MIKHLATRGSLCLFVRTHQHLQHYLDLTETRGAANQNGIVGPNSCLQTANVIEIHPVARVRSSPRR